ncbi:AbrB/MazE/SpoVT family DNA-binding domain-containing protein [Candidatus Woesearchaeota archaeon]|nr:AbrB/MazE/SpoVT family DNA-binding domain-containing protein [Candidatus Woesearchaeota archaeon]
MEQFEAVLKKWGNSLGITIPSEVIKEEKIKPNEKINVLVFKDSKKEFNEIFGTLKLKMPTQKAMEEIDEGYDEH